MLKALNLKKLTENSSFKSFGTNYKLNTTTAENLLMKYLKYLRKILDFM